jgi:hypothetical protein
MYCTLVWGKGGPSSKPNFLLRPLGTELGTSEFSLVHPYTVCTIVWGKGGPSQGLGIEPSVLRLKGGGNHCTTPPPELAELWWQ